MCTMIDWSLQLVRYFTGGNNFRELDEKEKKQTKILMIQGTIIKSSSASKQVKSNIS